jgi:predicted nucleic-acid-binding Zn-ribbon protein
MVVMWDGVSTHGTECPKCGNISVFKEEIYVGWFVFKIHKYDLYKCQMCDCDFIKKEKI